MKRQALHLPLLALLLSAAGLISGCGGSAPPSTVREDTQYAQASSAARIAYDAGLMPQAVLLYQRALDRAETMDDARAISDAAYNLAAALVRNADAGDLSRARRLLEESRRASLATGGDITASLLLEAKICRLLRDRDGAGKLADQVLASAHTASSGRLSAHLLKGELAVDANDVGQASEQLKSARIDEAAASVPQHAGLAGLTGKVEMMNHQPAQAAAEFDRQADLLQQADLYREMAGARKAAGRAFFEAQHFPEAADRFYRAARSFAAQGLIDEARECTSLALQAARQSGDQSLIAQVQGIMEDRSITTQPASTAPAQ